MCCVDRLTAERDDLLGECVDKVEMGFDAYLQSNNGNPLTYDTVSQGCWPTGFASVGNLFVCSGT